jgi:RNA polymerase sigma-70 factor (ECF subfamily)
MPRAGSSEDRIRIQAAAANLPRAMREPFVLIDILGYSYRETSEILGVKVGTLKSRMHRAHTTLMRMLAEEAAGEM